jgi:hypothetical protein
MAAFSASSLVWSAIEAISPVRPTPRSATVRAWPARVTASLETPSACSSRRSCSAAPSAIDCISWLIPSTARPASWLVAVISSLAAATEPAEFIISLMTSPSWGRMAL